ncbi:MAG: TlpA family protein disulfide reductase [Sphingobacteriales bacterium]|nr:MAG: TlpA family protein disulfide reductase [Sphingobacteriales bacterium]
MVFSKIAAAVVVAVLCLYFGAYGQVNESSDKGGAVDVTAGGLQIGDVVPDVLVSGVHNNKVGVDGMGVGAGSFRLSDFRGKLLILDFWATWCAPCVAMMPRLDSLSRRFGDKLAIVSVGYQGAGELLPFMERLERDRALGRFLMPMVAGDTVLGKLLPHRVLPHYVWIDGEGKVLAITGQNELTEEKIGSVLGGVDSGTAALDSNVLERKRDLKVAYDIAHPLFLNGNGGDGSKVSYRSMLSEFVPGISPGYRIFPLGEGKVERITANNQTMLQLMRLAYGEGKKYYGWSRLVLESAHAGKLRSGLGGQAYEAWLSSSGFCYELLVPSQLSSISFAIMKKDLSMLFPDYSVTVERRKVRCLVIRRLGELKVSGTAGGKPFERFGSFGFELRNVAMASVAVKLEVLYLQHLKLPVVDATGIAGGVDMKVEARLGNVASLNAGMKAYGIELVEQDMLTDVLVVRDAKQLNKR